MMKRVLQIAAVLVALTFSWIVATWVFPVPTARASIALADEVEVQRIFVPMIDAPARPAPSPISLHGETLDQVRRNLRIMDGNGAYCFCDGDFRLRFKRFGLILISFRGHVSESPPRVISSQPLNIEPQGARRLSALLKRIAPR